MNIFLLEHMLHTYFYPEFFRTATAPKYVCENRAATLDCIVQFVFDDKMVVTLDVVWKRNGNLINDSTPRHVLIRNSMVPPRVVGVLVKEINLDDRRARYTCTVNHPPHYFYSVVTLNVLGKFTNIFMMMHYALMMHNAS